MLNSTTLAATTVTTTETTVAAITTNEFVFCTAASLVLGLIIAFAFNFRQKKTKSFMMTLALLPVIVQVVIMLVNGNIGTGVAVMGAFSLVRFRSVPEVPWTYALYSFQWLSVLQRARTTLRWLLCLLCA